MNGDTEGDDVVSGFLADLERDTERQKIERALQCLSRVSVTTVRTLGERLEAAARSLGSALNQFDTFAPGNHTDDARLALKARLLEALWDHCQGITVSGPVGESLRNSLLSLMQLLFAAIDKEVYDLTHNQRSSPDNDDLIDLLRNVCHADPQNPGFDQNFPLWDTAIRDLDPQ